MKKDDDQFRADILQLLKEQKESQQKQIDDFKAEIGSLAPEVPNAPDVTDQNCAVQIIVSKRGGISDIERTRRANEVAKLIRPIMEQYELAELSARFQRIY